MGSGVKKIFCFLLFFLSAFAFSSTYKIGDVEYNITGKTRKYALATKVKVDKKQIFQNEDELMAYINDFKQRLENTRAFSEIEVDFKVTKDENAQENKITGETENETQFENDLENSNNEVEIFLVTLIVTVQDSHHLLILPYPKYDSNNGFSIKLKMRDSNFVGTLETMSGDVNFAIEKKDGKDPEYQFGGNIAFDIPFPAGKLDAAWKNDFTFSYTIGKSTPEWNFKTGVAFEAPFERCSINFDFYQSFVRDLDYEDDDVNGTNVHYGDGTYFIEDANFSVPVILQKVPNWGNIYYTPFFNITYNWDADGISDLYPEYDAGDGLMSPVIKFGQKLSTSRVNWHENFRTGIDVTLSQSISYNLQTYTFSPGVEFEFKGYKAFKYVGLQTDIYAFGFIDSNQKIGDRLRGIRDDQYFDSDYEDGEFENMKACSTPAALVVSIDIPIRLFRIYWDRIPGIKKIPHIGILNLEFQLAPFIDFALIKNRATKTTFDYRDGFLCGGLEAIVYPLKWKGLQVRVSFGVDLSRKMPFIKGKLNQEWRDTVSAYELSIGIGLQY